MIRRGRHYLSLLLVIFPLSATAAWKTVHSSSSTCDQDEKVCLQSTIRFESNSKIMEIRGHLHRTAGPGTLTFEFFGTTPLGEQVYHASSVDVRGRYNESISHKFAPPYSNRTEWTLNRITFQSAR